MDKVPRIDSSAYKMLVAKDHEVSALTLALVAHEILSESVSSAAKVQRRLDFLLHEFVSLISGIEDPIEILSSLNDFLFNKKKFNSTTHSDPESDMDLFVLKALENRRGHALTLSLIYRELARRAQSAPVNLVNFPGFFLVKVLYRHQLFFLDPSDAGRVLPVGELQTKLSLKFGKNLLLNGTFLETPSEIQTITRFLSKLKNIYSENRKPTPLLAVLDMLIATNPQRALEYRERGMLLHQLGSFTEALADLNTFIEKSQPSPEVEKIKIFLAQVEHPNVTPLF